MADNKLLLSFFGPSGSGKTTCYKFAADFLKRCGYEVHRADVAYPLRCIQTYAYSLFGRSSPGIPERPEDFKQDGELLGFLAKHFEANLGFSIGRSISRTAGRRANKICVINTDCRNNAHAILKEKGFIFIKITARPDIIAIRKLGRGDLTPFNPASNVENYDLIKAEYEINNNDNLGDLRKQAEEVLVKILKINKSQKRET